MSLLQNHFALPSDSRQQIAPLRKHAAPSSTIRKVLMTVRRFAQAFSLYCVFALPHGAVSHAVAQSGIASVYSYKGGRTANGETSHPHALTAAHRSLPFGTMVRVTNRKNGRTVTVRINDRGPFVHGRIIDLTPTAAQMLGFSGLAPVMIEVVNRS
jgi:rare lipoprotein A